MRILIGAAVTAAVTVSTLVVATPAAMAYCTTGMGRWLYSDHTPNVRSTIPSTWNSSVATAIARWNGISGSTLHYYSPIFRSQVANPEFTVERIDFAAVGLPDVPGYSFNASAQNHRTADLALNSRFTFNTTGTMNQAKRLVDVQTIVVHEAGHVSGLAHPYPEVCGSAHPTAAEKASVMYVNWTAKRVPNADDRAGIAARY